MIDKVQKDPIFKNIFAESWNDLPPVMKKHYANYPYSDDITVVDGILDFSCSGPIKWFAPLFWLMNGIPPLNETNVPVSVSFESDKNSNAFHFNRVFHFNNRKPYHFRSKMIQTKGNEVIEVMRFGFCWKMNYLWEENRVMLKHKGYLFKLFKFHIPIPIEFILGKGYAEEVAVDDKTFEMQVNISHPLWGEIYRYTGRFVVKQES
ncbi:MAG: DUF4166 domain-containing protein [Gammaproteobacteria bacterium]